MSLFICVFLVLYVFCANGSKIHVDIFYEPLQPESQRFITEQFYPVIGDGFLNEFEFNLIPFGNSTFNLEDPNLCICPNGDYECDIIKMHACVLKHLQNKDEKSESYMGMSFIYCLMNNFELPAKHRQYPMEKCSNYTKIGWKKTEEINQCIANNGNELFFQMGLKTKAMKPKLQDVPLIVMDDKYDWYQNENAKFFFKSALCNRLWNYGRNIQACEKKITHTTPTSNQNIALPNSASNNELFSVIFFVTLFVIRWT